MEIKADKIRWTLDNYGTWISLLTKDGQKARFYAEENVDTPQRVKLTKWREKRSLSANAYAWELLGKLSAVLHIKPEEIYQEIVKAVGGNAVYVAVPAQSIKDLRDKWSHNGLGWTVDVIGASDQPGIVDVAMYYGSSVFDTAQMARLIDLIIDECRENGVEYLPPEKISAMLEDWDNAQKDKSTSD